MATNNVTPPLSNVVTLTPTPADRNAEWRAIAAAASTETDGKRLTQLVEELCRALDRRSGK